MTMTKTDTPLTQLEDVRTAMMLLTRLPLPTGPQTARFSQAAWAYPLVGLALALLAGLMGAIAQRLGLPATLVAMTILATTTFATGAMHEDGLADTADGFWGGWDKSRRLEIMKDSHIGSYGVLALIFSFAARWAALTAIIGQGGWLWLWALIAAACLSRAAMPPVMYHLPHARKTGLSHLTGRPSRSTVLLGCGVGLGLALAVMGFAGLKLALLTTLAAIAMAGLSRWKIEGQTGDTLGATQQICEISLLAALAI